MQRTIACNGADPRSKGRGGLRNQGSHRTERLPGGGGGTSRGPQAHGRGTMSNRWSQFIGRLPRMATLNGVGTRGRGTTSATEPAATFQGALAGDGHPQGADSRAGPARSLTQPPVATHGAPAVDGGTQWHGPRGAGTATLPNRWSQLTERLRGRLPQRFWPTRCKTGECCPAGGRSSRSVYGGWQPPMAWAHGAGGRGVLQRLWSPLRER